MGGAAGAVGERRSSPARAAACSSRPTAARRGSKIGNGLPTFEQDGLGRIGITVAPSMPIADVRDGECDARRGLYRSDDAGENWYRATTDTRVATRESDFAEVKVDPKNPDIVYTASVVTWKSTDGGKTFNAFRGAPGGDDYHRIWINPNNPNIDHHRERSGRDRHRERRRDVELVVNQPTAAFYHVAADNAFPYRVCSGQQESGSACVDSRGDDGRISIRNWHPAGVEEYGYAAPDPLDPDIVYGGKVSRYDRTHGRRSSRSVRTPAAAAARDYRSLRTAPLVFSTVDPHALFFGSNVVWKTIDGGKSVDADQSRSHAHRFDRSAEHRRLFEFAAGDGAPRRRRVHHRAVVRRRASASGPAPTTG